MIQFWILKTKKMIWVCVGMLHYLFIIMGNILNSISNTSFCHYYFYPFFILLLYLRVNILSYLYILPVFFLIFSIVYKNVSIVYYLYLLLYILLDATSGKRISFRIYKVLSYRYYLWNNVFCLNNPVIHNLDLKSSLPIIKGE